MDEPVYALAILSSGLFLIMLVTSIFYVLVFRPRLLSTTTVEDERWTVVDERLRETIQLQRELAGDLQQQIDTQTEQVIQHMTMTRQEAPQVSLQKTEIQALLATHRQQLDEIQQQVGNQHLVMRERVHELSKRLTRSSLSLRKLAPLVSANREQKQLLNTMQGQLDEVMKALKGMSQQPAATIAQDRLTDVKGIGPIYSGKLRDVGIHTFKQLASLTPEELDAIIGAPKWRAIDATSWIEQAKLLASKAEKLESMS